MRKAGFDWGRAGAMEQQAAAELDRNVYHADGSPILTLTEADAAADLAGTPRPDNPTVEPTPELTPEPPVYVPAVDIAPSEELVEVVFSRPVSVYVQSSHREFAPGKTTITAGMFDTIKQTHQADAVSRG